MLNKQSLTVAIASILCCAAVQVDAAKPAKGGGGNHIQRGIQLAQEKHYDAAADEFGKAIKDNPKDARAYANRGTAYRQGARTAIAAGDSEGASTRYQAALADFAKYIELAPKDASGYTEHGQTLSELKQYDAALADFNKALEISRTTSIQLSFVASLRSGSISGTKRLPIFRRCFKRNLTICRVTIGVH